MPAKDGGESHSIYIIWLYDRVRVYSFTIAIFMDHSFKFKFYGWVKKIFVESRSNSIDEQKF